MPFDIEKEIFDIEKEIREANAVYLRALINHSDPTIGFGLPWFIQQEEVNKVKHIQENAYGMTSINRIVPDLTELRHVK